MGFDTVNPHRLTMPGTGDPAARPHSATAVPPVYANSLRVTLAPRCRPRSCTLTPSRREKTQPWMVRLTVLSAYSAAELGRAQSPEEGSPRGRVRV